MRQARWMPLLVIAVGLLLGLVLLVRHLDSGRSDVNLSDLLAGPTPMSQEAALAKLRVLIGEAGNHFSVGCVFWPPAAEVTMSPSSVMSGLPVPIADPNWLMGNYDWGYGGPNHLNYPKLVTVYDTRHPAPPGGEFRQVDFANRTCLVPQ